MLQLADRLANVGVSLKIVLIKQNLVKSRVWIIEGPDNRGPDKRGSTVEFVFMYTCTRANNKITSQSVQNAPIPYIARHATKSHYIHKL